GRLTVRAKGADEGSTRTIRAASCEGVTQALALQTVLALDERPKVTTSVRAATVPSEPPTEDRDEAAPEKVSRGAVLLTASGAGNGAYAVNVRVGLRLAARTYLGGSAGYVVETNVQSVSERTIWQGTGKAGRVGALVGWGAPWERDI